MCSNDSIDALNSTRVIDSRLNNAGIDYTIDTIKLMNCS